ncbi:MAG: hypothetical protein D9V44_09915 [Actinobacteria bacterium]|nr:MAG: hypothetical protein D9V44_09915 [Actinomycetota bacterium]
MEHNRSTSTIAPESARTRIALVVFAVLLVVTCAYRATLGISFVDDAHYPALTLRLAEGARPFVDEMTTQALGFLLAVPFAKAWTAVFGLSGFVLALRLFYVAVAAAVAFAVYRLLKPSFGALPAALGAAAPCLAPPYNIFGLSYNTAAMLGFMLAIALCVASLREGSRRLAAAAGASAAFAAISYPPLVVVAAVLGLAYVIVARSRRLSLAALGGAAVVVVVFCIWLLAIARIADIRHALDYANAVWAGYRSPAEKLTVLLRFARRALITRWTLPAWLLGAVAALPLLPRRVRSTAALLVPLVCLIPAARVLASGGALLQFGTNGAAYLVLLSATLTLPALATALAERDSDTLRGLAVSLPSALVGYFVVAYATSSGWLSAVPVIAVAPLAVIVLPAWCRLVARGRIGQAVATLALIGGLMALLYSTSFNDSPPLRLRHRFTSGALAGIATTPTRAADIERIAAAGQRWSSPQDRVLVLGRPLGYLLIPGSAHTNAVWLAKGPSDRYTVEYFEAAGAPDVAYISRSVISSAGGLEAAAAADPLVAYLARDYDLVETFDPFAVFVRR